MATSNIWRGITRAQLLDQRLAALVGLVAMDDGAQRVDGIAVEAGYRA
jgi:hypothetical protein